MLSLTNNESTTHMLDAAISANLSAEQYEIASQVAQGDRNILVIARAGTGKTYTIRKCLPLMRGRTAIAAYNSKIVKEMVAKVAEDGTQADVATFHSFGYRALRRAYPKAKIEGKGSKNFGAYKFDVICAQLEIPEHQQAFVKKAMSLAMQSGFGILKPLNVPQAWLDMVDHYDIANELGADNKEMSCLDRLEAVKDGCRLAARAVKLGIKMVNEIISFDDMIYAPLVLNLPLDTFDWVCVDEAQVSNALRREMARRMTKPNTGRMLWVGDNCQPVGTKVLKATGRKEIKNKNEKYGVEYVNIEDLVVGDNVVSYDKSGTAFIKKGKRVNGITRRPFAGYLTTVTTSSGLTSKYTGNHICLVNMTDLREKHAVYLMRRGAQYRVGKAAMDYKQSSGLSARMHCEKADAVWILGLYDTENEAFFAEQKIAGRFGIPQTCFEPLKLSRTMAAKHLGEVWGYIGDNTARGEEVLSIFGMSALYPLFETNTGHQQTCKRPFFVRACNLLSGMKVLPYNEADVHVKSEHWDTIIVSKEWYNGDVVSLDVDDTHLYIADGITTRNCQAIYGFTGADNDALEQIKTDFDCVSLPMTVTRRCGKAIVELAQKIVPDYKAFEGNHDGLVEETDEKGFANYRMVPGEDAIICRNTAPLVKAAYGLIARGVPAHVEGKEIGKGLLVLINKHARKVTSITDLRDKLTEYRDDEVQSLILQKKDAAADALNDKVETIFQIMQTLPDSATIDDLRNDISALFADTPDGERPTSVVLMTAHRSKGLEFKRVFGWGVKKFFPSKFAKQDWQMKQESNLEYVLITRAIETYVEVEVE
jgi:superfamily I DNA/RNA helicase